MSFRFKLPSLKASPYESASIFVELLCIVRFVHIPTLSLYFRLLGKDEKGRQLNELVDHMQSILFFILMGWAFEQGCR